MVAAVRCGTQSAGIAVPSSVVSGSSNILMYSNTLPFVQNSNLTVNHYLVQHVSAYVVIARYYDENRLEESNYYAVRIENTIRRLFYEKRNSLKNCHFAVAIFVVMESKNCLRYSHTCVLCCCLRAANLKMFLHFRFLSPRKALLCNYVGCFLHVG